MVKRAGNARISSLVIMLYRSKILQNGLKRGLLFTALVLGFAQGLPADTLTTPPGNPGRAVAPLIISGRQSARPAGTYSAGVAEIIKMLEAKVDAQVIFAYIQNSPIPYNPDAAELVALKEHGASTDMLLALIHHGDALRLQMPQAQGAVNPAPAAAPAYDYAPAAAAPAYPSDYYTDSSYAPYPATEYNYGYGYSYGWPVVYWPSVGIGGYRSYGYPHGSYYPNRSYGHYPGNSGQGLWASAPSAPSAPRAGSAPSIRYRSVPAVHSGSVQASGHSGGRSGSRSR
jgi:hypothetical protein